MSARARVEYDYYSDGVKLVLRNEGEGVHVVSRWPDRVKQVVTLDAPRLEDTTADGSLWLRLNQDEARAVYEALADHFGHTGNDTRALRRDYDAERARVDKFIAKLTRETP